MEKRCVKVIDKNGIIEAHAMGHKMTGNCSFHVPCFVFGMVPLPLLLFFGLRVYTLILISVFFFCFWLSWIPLTLDEQETKLEVDLYNCLI